MDERFFYFWDAIDKTTKWLWGFLSLRRDKNSAKELYRSIKYEADGIPSAIIHDGIYEQDRGFNKYFYHISKNVRLSEEEKHCANRRGIREESNTLRQLGQVGCA